MRRWSRPESEGMFPENGVKSTNKRAALSTQRLRAVHHFLLTKQQQQRHCLPSHALAMLSRLVRLAPLVGAAPLRSLTNFGETQMRHAVSIRRHDSGRRRALPRATTAAEAVKAIESNQTIYVHQGACSPDVLVSLSCLLCRKSSRPTPSTDLHNDNAMTTRC